MAAIYLDFNASTPLAPEVVETLSRLTAEGFGNPSSQHWAGTPARDVIAAGRRQVASLIDCTPEEVVFTSGGSEANNLALKGVYFAAGRTRPHFVTTCIEHPATLAPCAFLERLGARVTYLPVDRAGLVDPEDLRRAITRATVLVSIMHANNEVGTIQPVAECARIAHEHGALLHTDAAQSVGKIPTTAAELGADLISLAGHKFHAPKGIGALYVRKGIALEPLIHGAGHELGRRAGTESALLIGALGTAAELAGDLSAVPRVRALRDRLFGALKGGLGDRVVLNGHPELRLPNTLNVSFVGRLGTDVLSGLDGVAASTGSACHAGSIEISPVLKAMNVPANIAAGAVRFSLGKTTTAAEIDTVAAMLAA